MLDLEHLSQTVSFEMVEACRDRIFSLEAEAMHVKELATPACTRPDRLERSLASKALSPAKIEKEKKSLVKQFKKKLTLVKFYEGCQKVSRHVQLLAAKRFPTEVVEVLLGVSLSNAGGKVSKTFRGKEAEQALSLAPGDLQGAVWQKGGLNSPMRPRHLGNATLKINSLTLNYWVKTQRIHGSLVCVNVGACRKRAI